MKINNFSSGFLAVSIALAGTITVAPAQADMIGTLGWSNGTSNFYFPESEVGDPFTVTFSPDNVTLISTATAPFVPTFTPAPPPYIQNLTTPAVGQFSFLGQGAGGNRFFYETTNPLTFPFDNGASVTWPTGTVVAGEYDEPNSIQFQLSNPGNEFPNNTTPIVSGIPNLPPIAPSDVLQFGDSNAPAGGVYDAELDTVVPEPTTILGSLIVLGLGTSLKRKKRLLR